MTQRPFPFLVKLLSVGLLIYGVFPFDFVTDTTGLHAAFRRAQWTLFSSAAPHAAGHLPFEALTGRLMGAIWFAALGFLLAGERRAAAARPMNAWASAFAQGAALAVVIETLQLFTESHVFDLGALMLRIPAVAVGAFLTAYVLEFRQGRLHSLRSDRAVPSALLVMLAVLQTLAIQAACVDPSHFSLASLNLSGVEWLPFEALWHRPMSAAAGYIVSSVLAFVALSITLALALRWSGIKSVWPVTAATVLLVAFSAEALQLTTPTRTADVTGPILALTAVIAAWRLTSLLLSSQTIAAVQPEAISGNLR